MNHYYILFVASCSFSAFRGGIERFSIEMGHRFSLDKHHVAFLSVSKDMDSSEDNPFGFETNQYYLPNPSQIDCKENLNYLIQLIKNLSIDIVFNQQADNTSVTSLCYKARQHTSSRLVTILHFDPNHYSDIFRSSFKDIMSTGLPFCQKVGLMIRNTNLYRIRQRWLFGRVFTQAVRQSDAFILLSQNVEQRFLSMLGSVDGRKIRVIPNPITVDFSKSQMPVKQKKLIFVGRMTLIQKRPDLMLQIWERVYRDFPEWTLSILGDGDYLPTMQQMAAERQLDRIEFWGRVDTSKFYNSASIICITSNTEGFSLVTVEASQNYVVPIAFDSFSVVSDVIKHNITGMIVPAFDVEAYADALRQMMSDPERLAQMSVNAHNYVQMFNMDQIAPMWYRLFDELLTS